MQRPPPNSSERRPVSVLFTDMVGFTTVVDRLDEDRALAFSRLLYKLLTETVKAQGGTVHDFAGDSVMAVFGMPTAYEDAALRACRAAVAIHAAFVAAGPEIEKQFGLIPQMRVGISSGTAVVALADGDGSQMLAVGNTINLASRVQALAKPGGSLICDATRAQVEWLVDLGFDGEHQIKGLGKPQKLWDLRALREGATRFDVSQARGLSPLCGRDSEMAVLSENLNRSFDEMRVVDVVAEAGQGKTRLIFDFLRRDDLKDLAVLSGNCSADGKQVAFLPFVEVLRQYYRISNEDEPAEIAARISAGLRTAGLFTDENLALLLNLLGLPLPAGALEGLDGMLIGLRTRALLPALLQAQCQTGPVVLLVDDIHWIDTASEGLLRDLLSNGAQKNLLVLLLRRPEFAPDWLHRPNVTTMPLTALSGNDIRQLVSSRLGIDTPPEDLIRQVTDRAEGNPLFGEEILQFMLQQGVVSVSNGRASFDASSGQDQLPSSMQSLMTARMDRLAPQDRAVMQAAAVIGRRFDPGLLAMVAAKPDETGATLQRLQDQGMVYRESESSDYVFKHVLLRDTVYQGLLADAQKALHHAVGSALEIRSADRISESAESLAYHFGRTDRADLAFRYNALAGAKSLGVYSLDAAAEYFAAALANHDRAQTGIAPGAFTAFLADYALCLNISLQPMALSALAAKVLPALAQDPDSKDHARFLHHHIAGLIVGARFREAQEVRRKLDDMASRLGDAGSRAYALVSDLAVQCYFDTLPAAKFDALRQEAADTLAGLDDPYLRNYFSAHVAYDRVCRGLIGKANLIIDQMLTDGERQNDPRALGYCAAMRANISMISDDYAPALDMAAEALKISRADFEITIARNALIAAAIPLSKPDAVPAAWDFIAECAGSGKHLFVAGPEAMLGVGLALDGQIGRSIKHLEATVARFESEGWEAAAGWARLYLCEIYLSVLSGQGDASLGVLLRNIKALSGILLFGAKRITTLIEQIRNVAAFDPSGHFFARTELILGSLQKIKKRRELARTHLGAALHIVKPSGPSPLQTRIEMALADLG